MRCTTGLEEVEDHSLINHYNRVYRGPVQFCIVLSLGITWRLASQMCWPCYRYNSALKVRLNFLSDSKICKQKHYRGEFHYRIIRYCVYRLGQRSWATECTDTHLRTHTPKTQGGLHSEPPFWVSSG